MSYKRLTIVIIIFMIITNICPVFASNMDQESNKQDIKFNKRNIVRFPDINLERAIRIAISKPVGDITKVDLKQITFVTAEYANIKNLEGLQYCINLKTLGLAFNDITDIRPLENLIRLENLVLCSNNIVNIESIKELKNLKWLSLQGNNIINISSLKHLIKLTLLDIQQNNIINIKPIKNLTELTCLYLKFNNIQDYTPTAKYYNNLIKRDFNLDGSPYQEVFISHSCVPDNSIVADTKTVTVTYPDIAVIKEYSLDDINWYPYTEPIALTCNAYVYTRAIDESGNVYTGGIEVRNIVPSNLFEIVSNPTPDGVFAFKGINILSNREINIPTDWSKIKIIDYMGVELSIDNVTTTISTKELQIYSESIINGQYTLVIEPNIISDMQGNLYDKEIRINFLVELQDSSNLFVIVSNPTPDGVFTFKGINILSNRDINVPNDWSKIKILDTMGAEISIDNVTTTISTKELQVYSESITNGQYTLIIEPNVISDTQGNLYDKEIRINFLVELLF